MTYRVAREFRPDTTAKRAAALRKLIDHLELLPDLLMDAEMDPEAFDTRFATLLATQALERAEDRLAARWNRRDDPAGRRERWCVKDGH
ncbi:MAG: hypothetical protein ACF8XB_00915 [Planctomycetota bacterium JB042]